MFLLSHIIHAVPRNRNTAIYLPKSYKVNKGSILLKACFQYEPLKEAATLSFFKFVPRQNNNSCQIQDGQNDVSVHKGV